MNADAKVAQCVFHGAPNKRYLYAVELRRLDACAPITAEIAARQ